MISYKDIFKFLTYAIIIFSILIAVSEPGYGFAVVALFSPFIILTILLLWGFYLATKDLVANIASFIANPKKRSKYKIKFNFGYIVHALASLIFVIGAYLLIQFAAQGGPNKGEGFFYGYDAMQYGIAFIAIGLLISILYKYFISRTITIPESLKRYD